ncbi:MAG TPA: hypothetical protein VNF47_27445 [Streptosporangiaceae bacterium]|nr:hypothetical protein [Streptosporangiaceae bacterium]
MRILNPAVLAVALAAGALASLAAAIAGPAAVTAAASAARLAAGGGGGSGGCYPIGYTWICVYSGGGPGSGGSGGSATYTCTYAPASQGVLQRTGTGPPQPGYQWDIMTCPGANPGSLGGQLVQVSKKTGVPAISPVDLLKIAIADLTVPTLSAATAPPKGKEGLVGLPEWFWVPRSQWRRVSIMVTAGPVWANAVAIPTTISYVPGGGMSAVSCRGPGSVFDRKLPASQQHTGCSYTYRRPSAGQPGNAYQTALVVTWTISWTGSGGAGGVITNGFTTATAFAVRIAQAEALVTTP